MADVVRAREGYLVIADIAGYTAFLTGTELEHAQSIIEELTTVIRQQLAPPLRFVKLEGDAVFCYAENDAFSDGERLVELLEVCYFEFSNRLFNMGQETTCQCAACASIGSLDLKFIAHHGTFVPHRGDVAGPDVILVHRLLKNSITEKTGIGPYAFFTESCEQRLPPSFKLPRHVEQIEQFGETVGGVHNLRPVLEDMRDARRSYLSADDADAEVTIEVPYPPAVVWQYVVNPVQRLRWACVLFNKHPDAAQPNIRGRSGIGAKSHCNHGPAAAHREIIDWRPFRYISTQGRTKFRGGLLPGREIIETIECVPLDGGGTRIHGRVRYVNRGLLSTLTRKAMSVLLRGGIGHGQARLQAALESDMAKLEGADAEVASPIAAP